ncbi:hypothetical protein [Kordiimonas pumila]|uniref:Glycosyltransferase n=1 Tax=Kordiimonas pumila TaxID=2161677 RepID=A0ABV7DA02_9PROT|nr:hypothetical protein [Kordiimonas pumila]
MFYVNGSGVVCCVVWGDNWFMKNKKIAVINTANRPWAVIDTPVLMATCANAVVKEFYFSPSGRAFEVSDLGIDQTVAVMDGEQALYAALKAFNPDILYLRVAPHTRSEYLYSCLRQQVSAAKLFVEFYDLSLLFTRDAVGYIYGNDAAKVATASCRAALEGADGLIVKMGGKAFQDWAAGCKAPIISVFPALEGGEKANGQRADKTGVRKLLYAGSASARELNPDSGKTDGANLVRYFDAIAADKSLSLDIYNAAHSLPHEDVSVKFAALIERYGAQQNVHYHRASPRQYISDKAAGYDLGLCCAHYRDDTVMDVTRFGLPNRMMTYVDAGLPVIIDDAFAFAADLISRFGAGAVVPAGNMAVFLETIKGLNLLEAKAGVRALKHYMQTENTQNLAALKAMLMG